MYIIYNTEFDQSIQLELYKENGAVILVKRIYRVLQKSGATDSMTIILTNLNRLLKKLIGRFFGKFAIKWILKIPSHHAYVAILT